MNDIVSDNTPKDMDGLIAYYKDNSATPKQLNILNVLAKIIKDKKVSVDFYTTEKAGEIESNPTNIYVRLYHQRGKEIVKRNINQILYAFVHETGHVLHHYFSSKVDPDNKFSNDRNSVEYKRNEVIAETFAHMFVTYVGGSEGFEPNQTSVEYIEIIKKNTGQEFTNKDIAEALEIGYEVFQAARSHINRGEGGLFLGDMDVVMLKEGLNPYPNGVPVKGSVGQDLLIGEEEKDTIRGGAGNDYLVGGGGDDFLFGGKDDDILVGGKGNDVLLGEEGKDYLSGGADYDKYYADNEDTILDDEDGKGEVFFIKDVATEGSTTTVKLTGGTQKGASNIYEDEQGNKYRIEGKDIIINDGLKIERLF